MRLLLDEHLDPRLAEQLRESGYDVIAVAPDPALRGLSDAALLDHATAQGRVMVTYDVADFAPLLEERQVAASPVAGIVLISRRSYPPGERGHGRLLRALREILEEHRSPTAFAGMAVWLATE